MHIHILGICGTFMGGLAVLARQAGHTVTGSDRNVYPPMSTQLQAQGIDLIEGFDPAQLSLKPDLILIGNALSRGLPIVETILTQKIPFMSGPAWLSQYILAQRRVLAIAGTHGKTTTSTMLAWILEQAGLAPGFLIGGVPTQFDASARLGRDPFFVIEADEYDSAFFDKRSKFVHYFPEVLVINNLEFDHADIFEDLSAIQKQFHHVVRCVPATGSIITQSGVKSIEQTLAMGCWSPVINLGEGGTWQTRLCDPAGGTFEVWHAGTLQGTVQWPLIGEHNVQNALSALVTSYQVGVPITEAIEALNHFQAPKRRLEVRGKVQGVTVYDDFAHHPTAIASTLAGLRARVGQAPIIAILECESNTMRQGYHSQALPEALAQADHVILMRPQQDWGMEMVAQKCPVPASVAEDASHIMELVHQKLSKDAHILVMSNKNFAGLHDRLLQSLGKDAIE